VIKRFSKKAHVKESVHQVVSVENHSSEGSTQSTKKVDPKTPENVGSYKQLKLRNGISKDSNCDDTTDGNKDLVITPKSQHRTSLRKLK